MRTHLTRSLLVCAALVLIVPACDPDGGEDGEATAGEDGDSEGGAEWEGNWEMTEEDGVAPEGYGVNLTLTSDSFVSEITGAFGCTSSGTASATDTEMTWEVTEASAPPCDQSLNVEYTGTWSLDASGDVLTLDWTDNPNGALQVYARQ